MLDGRRSDRLRPSVPLKARVSVQVLKYQQTTKVKETFDLKSAGTKHPRLWFETESADPPHAHARVGPRPRRVCGGPAAALFTEAGGR